MVPEHAARILAELPPDIAREVREAARPRALRARGVLFRQGDAARSVYVLVEGRVRVVQDGADGRETLVHFIGPGELFGCVPILGADTFPGTATAAEASRVLEWQTSEFERLMARHPALAKRVLAAVGSRLHELRTRLHEATTERVEQRVARAVLRLARQLGRRTDEGIRIELELSRAELANMTGTTVYSASRILSAWQRRGIVSSERRRLLIRRPHDLVAIAEDLASHLR